MAQRQSRYSLRSGTQVPPAFSSSASPLSEVDEGDLPTPTPPNSCEYEWRSGRSSLSPSTPTRVSHSNTTAAPSAVTSVLLADARRRPSSPALGPPRRTRRALFPHAPHSGQGTRPFTSVGETPGAAAVVDPFRSPSYLPTSSPGPSCSPAALVGPMFGRGDDPSVVASWLLESAPLREENGGTVVAARVMIRDGTTGEEGHAASVGDWVGTRGWPGNFAQSASPVPETPFVPGGHGQPASSPASRSVANPVASSVAAPTDPYGRHRWEHENSDVLTGGSRAVAVHGQLERGGHGGTEWLARDGVSQEAGPETAYPDPGQFLRGPVPAVCWPPTATRGAPPPGFPFPAAAGIHPTSITNHPACPFSLSEMAPTGFSANSGNRQTESAAVSSKQGNNTQAISGSAAELSDSFIDPALFATTTSPPPQLSPQQQPTLDQPIKQESAPSSTETMEPSVARESAENEQFYAYQLAQSGVRNSADDETGSSRATGNEMHGTANANVVGSAQNDLSYQNRYTSDPHFELENQPQNDDVSTETLMGSDMDLHIALSQASSGCYESCGDNSGEDGNLGDGEGEHGNNSSNEDWGDDDDEPMPHIPDVHPDLLFDPQHNPAAAYWTSPPQVPNMDCYRKPAQRPPPINMYDPPLPAFDSDPFLPFAPWCVNQLPPFTREASNRVITITARNLAAVGRLYPDATFLISRYPASANSTVCIKGTALVTSAALHLPTFTDPAQSHNAARDGRNNTNNDNNASNDINNPVKTGDDGPLYIAALLQRDWPIGGVAFFPYTAAAQTFIEALQDTFDILPHNQEAFYFLPHDVRFADGSVGRGQGVWVCRAYEGRKGPQDRRLVEWWMKERGRELPGAEQDAVVMGREVLVRMGEAFIETEKWPRASRAAGGKRKRGSSGGGGGSGGGGAADAGAGGTGGVGV